MVFRGALKRIEGEEGIVPKYKIGFVGNNEPAMVIDRGKAVMGYSDFVCTNDRFYAIYVGLPFDGNQLEGNEIHVFNMEGTLLEKIIVDHKLVYLSIDEKSRLLYGVQRNHFPKIYKIAL